MPTKPLEDREFQFVYLYSLLSNTQFITCHKFSKLQVFHIRFFQNFFPEWKLFMAHIVCKNCFLFQVEIKKNSCQRDRFDPCITDQVAPDQLAIPLKLEKYFFSGKLRFGNRL